ncbi:L-sorbosone dehydrogenase [Tolypocladium capitatum]|uniref:L-sorbosone dehydrogenase n=1 Tax=Tolypocladium capitatum TaxID=45235 RepID=A0A2K3QJB0_9HYPO|nr:L-sorbosone dehydrogenase [Tolypocladium capitatum]
MAPLRLVLGALCAAAAAAAAARCSGQTPAWTAVTAPGVQHKVLLNDLAGPRGIVIDSEGNLLVVEQGGKGVRRVVLDDGEGLDVCVTESSQLVDDSSLSHGIALSSDGKTLFASSPTDVYAYAYDAAKGTAGAGRNIITGMDQGGHFTRSLLVPRHNPNLLLVSRGSEGNIDADTTDVGSARSQIRTFKIDALLGDGGEAVQYASGAVLGWGLRNSVGVAEDPTTGYIWSVENSIDDMTRSGRDIHNTNPGEELNFHGLPNDTSSAVYGRNYGYPACVAIWDSDVVEGYAGGAATGKQMVGDQMPSNFTDASCGEAVAPYVTLSAHLAPLDMEFQDDGSAAYISMHGSWNRQPPNGYRLSRLSFAAGFPVHERSSQDAEERIMWNADDAACPGGCFRPVGLALGGGGKRLYMTSDATGELTAITGFRAPGTEHQATMKVQAAC